MLDQTTKKRINDLRDTLVGKLPDPKSQVEQIMIAMIYKFMNDMDDESKELGGNKSFFIGDYEKYSWENLFNSKISGTDLVSLYKNGVESMENNPNIPQLFRNIFKNAYIPYKDPKILRSFLIQINEFKYSYDSEQLGDSFEHLLSSLNSQGDAGQFRTPRHIIDFIVKIIDPQKQDKILDPASGTSGFLISAYKHIIKNNSDAKGVLNLSEIEHKKVMENMNGYDLSPDMVRIGLSNMYLHGFDKPNIIEYDPIRSDERWDEYYDVILANPPFVSPKDGIGASNKFSLQSSRIEIFFLDYIMSHLKPGGRAGIIVPEGIIFNTDNAHSKIREKLLNSGLVGIISLPAGVFQPYTDKKTSILIIDKSKKIDSFFYSVVHNDGYSLTTNRTEISENDLPNVLSAIKQMDNSDHFKNIPFKDIEQPHYSFSFFTEDKIINDSKFKKTPLKNLAKVVTGNSAPQDRNLFVDGKYPFFRTSDAAVISKNVNLIHSADLLNEDGIKGLKLSKKGSILFQKSGASTLLNHRSILGVDGYVASHLAIIEPDENLIYSKYLFYILCSIDAKDYVPNPDYPSLKNSVIENFMIPLPTLEEQSLIINQIEKFENILNDSYKNIEEAEESIKSIVNDIFSI